MQNKVERLKKVLNSIDPSIELSVEDKGGLLLVYGPFPSFLIQFTQTDERFLIHVNADAATLVYYMDAICREFPNMSHDGAFSVDAETSSIVMGHDAYVKKDQNIIMMGLELMEKERQEYKEKMANEIIVPPEKKIVFA